MGTIAETTTITSDIPAEEVVFCTYFAKSLPAILAEHMVFMKAFNQTMQERTLCGPPTKFLAGSILDSVEQATFKAPLGLTSSIFLAYSRHHHLTLRPDDVWIAILTQFSFFVQANAEEFRSFFVDHDGKQEIRVTGGGSLKTADYSAMCGAILGAMAGKIKDADFLAWLQPVFTTTTEVDAMVEAVAAMATTQSYFEFGMQLMCGLPSVTLEGTVEDWVRLREHVEGLAKYNLPPRVVVFDRYKALKANMEAEPFTYDEPEDAAKLEALRVSPTRYKENLVPGDHMVDWLTMLRPVMDQFVATKKGEDTMAWWQSVATLEELGSGVSYLEGWVTVFSVFDKDGRWQGTPPRGALYPKLWTKTVPGGVVSVPVEVDDNGTTHACTLFAGTMAMVSEKGNDLRPRQDWALATLA